MMVDAVNNQLSQNTESILDFVVSWSQNRRQDVGLWASQSSIVQSIVLAGDDTEGLGGSMVFVREVNEDLRKYAQALPDYAEIGIVGRTGKVLTTSLFNFDEKESRRFGGDYIERNRYSINGFFPTSDAGCLVCKQCTAQP